MLSTIPHCGATGVDHKAEGTEPLYRIGVSHALSQLGRHDEAIDVLKEGVKDKPKYANYCKPRF